jgi:protein TonB
VNLSVNYDDETDQRSFIRRYGVVLLVIAAVFTIGVIMVRTLASSHASAPRHAQEITMVKLLPPPPPPPPEVQEQKMIDQTPVNENEPKPDDKPAPPTPSIGTGIKGNGPGDSFGLSGSGGSGSGGGGHAGGGSRWGWYAGEVQSAIQGALGKDSRTRFGSFSGDVKVWEDSTGRIIRARLKSAKGDAEINNDLLNKVLDGLILPDPAPAGMPMPIVMHITELRPN